MEIDRDGQILTNKAPHVGRGILIIFLLPDGVPALLCAALLHTNGGDC